MQSSPKHLITELGVLRSCSIAKKISAERVRTYKRRIKKLAKSKEEAEELLQKVVLRDAQKEIDPSDVPGMIVEVKSNKRQSVEKKLMDLTYFSSIVSKKANEKELSTFDKCYIVNVLVNMLKLSEEDFDNFHRIFSKFKSGEIESPDEDSSQI